MSSEAFGHGWRTIVKTQAIIEHEAAMKKTVQLRENRAHNKRVNEQEQALQEGEALEPEPKPKPKAKAKANTNANANTNTNAKGQAVSKPVAKSAASNWVPKSTSGSKSASASTASAASKGPQHNGKCLI
ncbi:hypothetical protein FRC06_008609 [Ceratobasidium sp. 370]|nr:hypothetical protein FRC06_008609 [Ceratobasidium sp. 370]